MCPLENKAPKHTRWIGRQEERHAAFTKVKTTLANATMLAHPSPKGPDFAVGTVHE